MRVARLAVCLFLFALAVGGSAGALDIEQDDQPPEGEVGTPYEFQFTAEEGCLPYRFSFLGGNLPPGLEVTSEGLLKGTPRQAGRLFEFYVGVDDSKIAPCRGSPQSQGLFRMKVLPDLAVATTSLPRPAPNRPYSFKLSAANPEPGWPLTWLLLAGGLPPGVSFAPDGTISGTPTTAGKWGLTVRVQEQFRRFGERELTLVVAAPLSLPGPRGLTGEAGHPFKSGLSPTGGLGPMVFAVTSGSLPPGVALDAVTGQIRGTPRAAGTFPVRFSVTDGGGERATLDTNIQIAPRLGVATRTPIRFERGERVNVPLKKTGGVGPVRWRIVRGAPAGIRLDSLNNRLRGVARVKGTYRVTIEARDALGVRARTVVILVIIG